MSEDLYNRFKSAVIEKERSGATKKIEVDKDFSIFFTILTRARFNYYDFMDKQPKTEMERLVERYLNEEKTFPINTAKMKIFKKLYNDLKIRGAAILQGVDARYIALLEQVVNAEQNETLALDENEYKPEFRNKPEALTLKSREHVTSDNYNPEVIELMKDIWNEWDEEERKKREEQRTKREEKRKKGEEQRKNDEARRRQNNILEHALIAQKKLANGTNVVFDNPMLYTSEPAPKPEAQQSSGFLGWVAKRWHALRGSTNYSSKEPQPQSQLPAPSDSGNVGNTQDIHFDLYKHGSSELLQNIRKGRPPSGQGGGKTRSRCKKTKRNKCKSKTRSKKHIR